MTWKKNYPSKISQMRMTKWEPKKKLFNFETEGVKILLVVIFEALNFHPPHPQFSLFLAGPSQNCSSWTREDSLQQVGDKRIRGSSWG